MKLQRLYSYIRQAVDEYQMIAEGDRIAVGISGGKDSLTLLYGLAGLRRFYPCRFEVIGITVDLGYEGFDLTGIMELCGQLQVEYHVVHTQISTMILEGECSKCARLRKGALNGKALELGCNKIAYGHNRDDVVETMMMSLIYEGRFSAFWPVTHFDDTRLDVIRPMILVPSGDVYGFRNRYQLPVTENPCPYDGETQRSYVRELLRRIDHHAPDVRKRMMTAIRRGNLEGWNRSDPPESPQNPPRRPGSRDC